MRLSGSRSFGLQSVRIATGVDRPAALIGDEPSRRAGLLQGVRRFNQPRPLLADKLRLERILGAI